MDQRHINDSLAFKPPWFRALADILKFQLSIVTLLSNICKCFKGNEFLITIIIVVYLIYYKFIKALLCTLNGCWTFELLTYIELLSYFMTTQGTLCYCVDLFGLTFTDWLQRNQSGFSNIITHEHFGGQWHKDPWSVLGPGIIHCTTWSRTSPVTLEPEWHPVVGHLCVDKGDP